MSVLDSFAAFCMEVGSQLLSWPEKETEICKRATHIYGCCSREPVTHRADLRVATGTQAPRKQLPNLNLVRGIHWRAGESLHAPVPAHCQHFLSATSLHRESDSTSRQCCTQALYQRWQVHAAADDSHRAKRHLCVGIDDPEFHTLQLPCRHAVDSIRSATANTQYLKMSWSRTIIGSVIHQQSRAVDLLASIRRVTKLG